MRREDLENQSVDVINNEEEMHGDLTEILKKINSNETYKKHFQSAFQTKNIDIWQIQNALATYIRSLSSFNSAFDKYMQGDKKALKDEEIQGFNLFIGKAKCATCHFIPLFNGTVPPDYIKTESEVLGTPKDIKSKNLSPDLGRGAFSHIDKTKYSFKTPTLRNINLTAPYMHNGVYNSLEEVMKFYNDGGGNSYGFNLDNQTLPNEKLNLSKAEISKIISFLNTLTDEQYKN